MFDGTLHFTDDIQCFRINLVHALMGIGRCEAGKLAIIQDFQELRNQHVSDSVVAKLLLDVIFRKTGHRNTQFVADVTPKRLQNLVIKLIFLVV